MIQADISLKSFNTFGVEAQARYFAEVFTLKQLKSVLDWYRAQSNCPLLPLGGGSNVLFTKNWPGLVLKLNLKEKTLVQELDEVYLVKAGAGENWHEFVRYTLDHGYFGLENLSLIPGSVGAAPLQNIGAYGVEIKDRLWELEALNIASGILKIFTAEECEFGYRDSVFKQSEKGKWVIVSVTFKLLKTPELKIDYGTIQSVLTAHKISEPTPKQVSQAITAIRQAKLPDPNQLGNAGSFFKNPIISNVHLQSLLKDFPDLPHYAVAENQVKIPAAWLIETAGWKGKNVGTYGVHKDQALVLVNYGGAKGSEIWQLAEDIRASVLEKFSITLTPEVNLI